MGGVALPNRVVCSAMTRCRADPGDGVPTDLHAEYYASRASSAFMLTECVPISLEGNGLPGCCGIYTDEQEAGWLKVVKAVHNKGGRIILQLWHGGRTCSPDQIGGLTPVSASAIALPNEGKRKEGKPEVIPKAATEKDI
jgi:N-ethylmaleimide reductase